MINNLSEFLDFIKYESQFGLRVLLHDLIMINKLYFRTNYINRLLNLASKNKYRFTFFVRSYDLKNKLPIIKRLKQEGHEIASHGHSHFLYEHKSKAWLRNEMMISKKMFDKYDIKILGFRSPFLSSNEYLYDILFELGFKYVSNNYNFNNIENSKQINRLIDRQINNSLTQNLISWPSDWLGLIVEKMKIEDIVDLWKKNQGTLLLHPWIFISHLNKLDTLFEGKKDFRIISNLKKDNLKISFDLY